MSVGFPDNSGSAASDGLTVVGTPPPLEGAGNLLRASREPCRIASTGELLSESANLTREGGIHGFVIHHERLASGHRASSPHFHSLREEFVLVLRGELKLWLDGTPHRLRSGDYASLPAGVTKAHYLFNDGHEEAEYLLVASQPQGDIVTYARAATRV